MNKAKAIAWFDEVAKKIPGPRTYGPPTKVRSLYDADFTDPRNHDGLDQDDAHEEANEKAALAFVMAAEQAIERTFPPTDPVVRRWREIFKSTTPGTLSNEVYVNAAVALFREAHDVLRSDRFETLFESVRAETVAELLDQAEQLLAQGLTAAAMVTAGGVVESTLRRLCANASISIKGHGSIEKYNSAIGEKRGEGIEVVSVVQSKMVTVWGDHRNRAAHYPIEFAKEQTKESVRNTIDAIRMFLGNVG